MTVIDIADVHDISKTTIGSETTIDFKDIRGTVTRVIISTAAADLLVERLSE